MRSKGGSLEGGLDDQLQELGELDPCLSGGPGQADAVLQQRVAVDLQHVRHRGVVQTDVHPPVPPAADGPKGADGGVGDLRGELRLHPRRADDPDFFVLRRLLEELRRVGHDRRDGGGKAGIIHFRQRQHARPLAPDDAGVELPPVEEALRQGGLLVVRDDRTDLSAQCRLARHHGVLVQPDAGVLLAGLHDHRELPLVAVHVADPLQQGGARRNGNAGALHQAGAHVLVAAQAQAERRGAGQGEAHHADQGGNAHLVERAVHHVVVLVEDHVRGEAQQPALESRQVVGQGHQAHRVAEPAQRPRQTEHQLSQMPHAAMVRADLREGFPESVVDQRDPVFRHRPRCPQRLR